MLQLLSISLLQPDTYINIGWGIIALLTVVIAFVVWRIRRHWLRLVFVLTLLFCWYVFLWGAYVGIGRLEVKHVDLTFSDLPEAFDGYKIVQFSDVHLSTYDGRRSDILRRAVDSILAQHADAIVFTGDLQNKEPSEIKRHEAQLSRIKAPDGVFSVLGNHDYTMYTNLTNPIDIGRNQGNTEGFQMDMGWTLLKNERRIIRRDSARIVIAGMENDGEGRFPQLGNINSTLYGISRDDFVIMLEHDPTSWRRRILPHSHTQLTLSGHTHGGQFNMLGLTPAMFLYREYQGIYHIGERTLYVSKGLGGIAPFRFGASPEIVVFTLHKR